MHNQINGTWQLKSRNRLTKAGQQEMKSILNLFIQFVAVK